MYHEMQVPVSEETSQESNLRFLVRKTRLQGGESNQQLLGVWVQQKAKYVEHKNYNDELTSRNESITEIIYQSELAACNDELTSQKWIIEIIYYSESVACNDELTSQN